MSRVYFHTKSENTVELSGRERANMGVTCGDIASALVPRLYGDEAPHYFTASARETLNVMKRTARDDMVGTFLRVGDRPTFQLGGEPLDSFSLVLNTVLAIGNDPLCLFARLHGQCEIHAYVEGPERAWLAGVIKQGLESGLYRRELGWEDVITLLEASNVEPVVTSFSVTDGFPNSYVAGWTPPEGAGEDAWYEDLTDDERWDLSIAGLRAQRDIQPLSPENLRGRFGHGKTLFDVLNQPSHAEVAR